MRATASYRHPGTAPDHSSTRVIDALNQEWRHRYERRLARAPGSWAADARLGAFRYVAEALAELEAPATGRERAEEVLEALAERAAGGDGEAARAVVQYLMPYLVADVCWPRGSGVRSNDEALGELVGAAWQAVAEGVERRGRTMKIALLRAVEYLALNGPNQTAARIARWEVSVGPGYGPEPAIDLWGRPDGAAQSAAEEVLELLADAAGAGLDPADVRLLGSLTVGACSPVVTARAEGVTVRCIRYRRAAALRRLADCAA